jgi:hypothetical protein
VPHNKHMVAGGRGRFCGASAACAKSSFSRVAGAATAAAAHVQRVMRPRRPMRSRGSVGLATVLMLATGCNGATCDACLEALRIKIFDDATSTPLTGATGFTELSGGMRQDLLPIESSGVSELYGGSGAGTYRIHIERPGYHPVDLTNVRVESGGTCDCPLTQTVEVRLAPLTSEP